MNTATPRRHEPHSLPAQRHDETTRDTQTEESTEYPEDRRCKTVSSVRRHKTNATLHETTGVSTSRRKKTRTDPPCPMTMRRLMRQMTMRTTLQRDGMTSKQRLAAANRTATEENSTRRTDDTTTQDDKTRRRSTTIRDNETQVQNA